jgi:hypothetical protein
MATEVFYMGNKFISNPQLVEVGRFEISVLLNPDLNGNLELIY